jgi:hypothetical protein
VLDLKFASLLDQAESELQVQEALEINSLLVWFVILKFARRLPQALANF